MRTIIIRLGKLGALLVVLFALHPVQAQTFPERPITLYIAFTAAGSADPTLRALGEAASRMLGKRIIVENKPGASGGVAAGAMARSKPDGYTLSQMTQPMLRVSHMQKFSFDPLTDFTWIIGVADYTAGAVVRADAPWKTWQEFVAHARANPGRVKYATTGIGGTMHVAMLELGAKEGVEWVNVAYRGVSEASVALIGGEVDMIVSSTGWAPLVHAGKLKILMALTESRIKRWPDVPTLKDLGYEVRAGSSYGIAGPKGMDPQVVRLLHDTFRKAMDDPDFLKVMERLDQVAWYKSPEDYARWVQRQYEIERQVVQRLGLKQ